MRRSIYHGKDKREESEEGKNRVKYTGTVTYKEIEFEVEGDYIPFIPGKMYLRNGDPGDPDEGNWFEDFDIKIDGISIYELLNQSAMDAIEQMAIEDAGSR